MKLGMNDELKKEEEKTFECVGTTSLLVPLGMFDSLEEEGWIAYVPTNKKHKFSYWNSSKDAPIY